MSTFQYNYCTALMPNTDISHIRRCSDIGTCWVDHTKAKALGFSPICLWCYGSGQDWVGPRLNSAIRHHKPAERSKARAHVLSEGWGTSWCLDMTDQTPPVAPSQLRRMSVPDANASWHAEGEKRGEKENKSTEIKPKRTKVWKWNLCRGGTKMHIAAFPNTWSHLFSRKQQLSGRYYRWHIESERLLWSCH